MEPQPSEALAQRCNVGQFAKVTRVSLDCDNDAVLVEVEPLGPGAIPVHIRASAWNRNSKCAGALFSIEEKKNRPEGVTRHLFNSGLDKILKKVGEESTETIVAAKNSDPERLVSETGV
jgi:phosphoribosyl-ATP pyrophosphohydrolase/phosphoribosyl-AMP cyclohydrolase